MAETNGHTGYHAETIIYSDEEVRAERNVGARWFVLLLVVIGIPCLGWMVGALFGLLIEEEWGWLSSLLSRIGFITGGFFLGWFVPRYGLLTVPEVQGFVSQDPLEDYYSGLFSGLRATNRPRNGGPTGNMVIYGPGLHPTYFWETRDRNGNHSTQNVTKRFVEELPSLTAGLKTTVALQYQPSLLGMRRFHLSDMSTIEEGIESFVRSFLSGYLARISAEDAKNDQEGVNRALVAEFKGRSTEDGESPVTKFERGYGIHITALTIEGIDFSDKVQAARDARDEGAQMMAIIAANTGFSVDELRDMAKNNPRRYDALLDKAMVQSGNATQHVQVLQGSASDAISAALGNVIRGNGGNGGDSSRNQTPRPRANQRKKGTES